jgi:hypothetical protein
MPRAFLAAMKDPAGTTEERPGRHCFYLREDRSELFWGGEDWVSSLAQAKRFVALERVFAEARRVGRESISLLAVLEASSRTIIFPLDDSRSGDPS